MKVQRIVIKDYKEFTEDIDIEDLGTIEASIVAKEIEAVIQLENGAVFSIGFSVMRDNPIFEIENPRDLVRNFIKINLMDSE